MWELASCRAGAEHLYSVYGTTLLKMVNHDYPYLSQKIEAMIFPADGTLLNFFGGGEPECFHCMLCYFLILDLSDSK
jgi:hypothetical protein